MKKSLTSLLIIFPFFFIDQSYGAKFQLTTKDKAKIDKGEIITYVEEVEGAPWPIVTVIGKIETTPIQAISIFSSYEDQVQYIPDMLTAKTVKAVSPTDKHVSFEMKMPWPFSNTFYTTGNVIKRKLVGNSKFAYEVSWYFVKSDSSTESKGYARFHPYNDKTIFEYRSFIVPKSFLANLLTGIMKSGIQKTFSSIVQHIENVKSKKPLLLKKYFKSFNKLQLD